MSTSNWWEMVDFYPVISGFLRLRMLSDVRFSALSFPKLLIAGYRRLKTLGYLRF